MEAKEKTLKEVIDDMSQAEKAINNEASSEKKQAKSINVVDKTRNGQVPVKVDKSPWVKLNDDFDDKVEKLYKFVTETKAVVTINQGHLDEKTYALAPAWEYLATICGYYVRIEDTWEEDNSMKWRELTVHCRASLISKDNPNEPVTTVESVVETDEDFLRGKPLNVAYGWAQTRAKCRAVQTVLGSLMTRVKIQATPAEEII